MKIRHKLLVGWAVSSVLLLVLTGILFVRVLDKAEAEHAGADIASAFAGIAQHLEDRRETVHRAAVLMARDPGVVAGLHLLSTYEDPANYRPLVFDTEKRRLAHQCRDEALSAGVDLAAVADLEGELAAFFASGRAEGHGPLMGYMTWKNGTRAVVRMNDGVGRIPPPADVPLLLQGRKAAPPPSVPRVRLTVVAGHLVVVGEAPAMRYLADGSARPTGTVIVAAPFGAGDVTDVVGRNNLALTVVGEDGPWPESVGNLEPADVRDRLARPEEQGNRDYAIHATGDRFIGAAYLPLEGERRVFLLLERDKPPLGEVLVAYGEASLLALLPMVLVLIPAGAFALHRWFIRPLETLARDAEAVREGRIARVRLTGRHDELGTLAQALDAMVRALIARENEIRLSRQQYQDLYDYAPVAYASIRALDGRLLRFNRAFEHLLGYSADELSHLRALDLYAEDPPGGRDEARKVFLRFRAGEPVHDQELRVRRKDGTILWVSLSVDPVFGDDGQVVESRSALIDIDGRKKAEEALRQSVDDLTRANAALTQFAHIAAHDLREPIRQVVSYTQLLQRNLEGRLDPEQAEYAAFVVDGAKRLNDLLGGLLAFAQAEAGRRGREKVDLGKVVAAVVENVRPSIEQLHADVHVGDLPEVVGDEIQLLQVFQNLIGNAIKFRAPERTPHIAVRAERRGAEWLFSVRDNGIGFEPAFKNRIFEMFERIHPGDQYPGTGIGLAICRKIVEANGGSIWAESRPDEGATFWFTWPADPVPPPDGDRAGDEPAAAAGHSEKAAEA